MTATRSPKPRVKVTHNKRNQLTYAVSTAPPGEDFTEIARFKGRGDAHSYAQTVRSRIAEHTHLPVHFTSTT